MTSTTTTRYTVLASKTIAGFSLFGFALFMFFNLHKIHEIEQGTVQSVWVWAPLKWVYVTTGSTGVLALSVAVLSIGLVVAHRNFSALRALRAELGVSTFIDQELDYAREMARTQILVGGMPSHLKSKEAYLAYKKRVKAMLVALVSVFALVGIAAVLGLLS